jgi:sugar lactone lactonase YvrE
MIGARSEAIREGRAMGHLEELPRRHAAVRLALLGLLCVVLVACGRGPVAAGAGQPAGQSVAVEPAPDGGPPAPASLLPPIKAARIATIDGAAGPFGLPIALAVDRSGHVFVADARDHSIHKYDRDGRFLTAWGGAGSDDRQFRFGSAAACDYLGACGNAVGGGLAVDDRDHVYVADWGNNRVQKFSGDGELMARWGRAGHGPGEFVLPESIAVDGQGHVYVNDGGGRRVQRFDRDGRFLGQWEVPGAGKFDGQNRLAVAGSNRVWAAQGSAGQIEEFDVEGRPLAAWATGIAARGKQHPLAGVAADRQGRLYVLDGGYIRVFAADRQWLASWDRDWLGEARLLRPSAMAIDAEGDVYVADQEGGRIHHFRLLIPVVG